MKTLLIRCMAINVIFLLASFLNISMAQVDTTGAAQPDTTVQPKSAGDKEKKERKRKDEIILYAGPNFNMLGIDEEYLESSTEIGYHLGAAYKRGRFFYWQVGGRFSNSVYGITEFNLPGDSTYKIPVRIIDVPITGGINFLAMVNRLVALRVFVSAVPSFALGVKDNDLDIVKDDLNSFILYGQGGVGVNVAFFVLEAGYNFGFQDQFKDLNFGSKPGQLFINLGFRF